MLQQLDIKNEAEIELVKVQLDALYQLTKETETDNNKYLGKVTRFVLDMMMLEDELNEAYFTEKTFDELLVLNHSYYEDILGDNYKESYTNPNYAVGVFGEKLGQVLSVVHTEIRECVGYAFEHRKTAMMHQGNKILLVAKAIQSKEISEIDVLALIDTLRDYMINNIEDDIRSNIYRKFYPEFDIYSKISKMDLMDARYIFRYGMYISNNEIELVNYFATCSKDKIKAMANTYTEAFERGYERGGMSMELKKTVNVGYHIGFELVIQEAFNNFERMGLKPVVYYDIKGSLRPRIMNTKPNKQFEYDHRFDDGIYLNDELVEVMLKTNKKVLSEGESIIKTFAGPGVVEVFGELPFSPMDCQYAIKYSEQTTELKNKFMSAYQQVFNQYLPRSEYSFVLISYPVPEIGDNFSEIFDETIKVNTLDEQKYMDIQQRIIEALDQGVSATITGRNGNKTNLTVMFSENVDTSKQTNFNNCTADVNVPVGEVFTSPKLMGTTGKLHVMEVYLSGLKYKNLEIDFKDGYIENYTCTNFDEVKKNKEYVHENLLHPHKTLPLGEFAIGTNTTAYVMAKKFNIEKIIPILIGEKMGPHFAIGDTCYTWAEDTSVYNPDGREIVARENEKTCKRKDNPGDAYTYKHTDITIPYSELNKITVNKKEGSTIDIISEGRFILDGCEALNDPLKDIEV